MRPPGRNWTSSTATACGWASWSTRCWTSPGSRPGGCRPGTSRSTWPPSPPTWPACSGPRWSGPGWPTRWTARPCPTRSTSTRRCGRRSFSTCSATRSSSPSKAASASRCGPTATQAVLRIADTGVGVAADEMPRLFERFHRIPNARSRSNEGSGIGLALVRELVGLHGGTITADEHRGIRDRVHHPAPVRPRPPARQSRGRRGRAQHGLRGGRPVPGRGAALAARKVFPPSAPCPRPRPRPPRPGRTPVARPGSWSPTTTPTCAST